MLSKVLNILLVVLILSYVGYYIYKLPKYNKGESAPEFSAKLINGGSFSLHSLRGKYVLLDFWGSWCGPCRTENPELVSLYQSFGPTNTQTDFEIVSVAIERNPQSALKAIERDGLNWPYHICQEGRFNSEIAKQYGVREIPTKYLIDREGQIIATNPSFEEIRTVLTDNL